MGKFVCMYFLEKLLKFSKAATGDVLEKYLCRFKKETPTQGFSCEYCEIFKNSFFNRASRMAASELCKMASF